MYFGMFDPTVILLIPAIIFTFYAQSKVQGAYRRFSSVRNRRGITGEMAARMLLDANGLSNVRIEMVSGTLSDHYDPGKRVMRLSPDVYGRPSVAAVSIAAHETGHAIQHAKGYAPLRFRTAIAPAVQLVSTLSWPLLLIGLLMSGAGYYMQGNLIFNIGIFFFVGVILFHAVTLPVELDASKRAIEQMQAVGIIYPDEVGGARKVLSAAALTYVAALATAIANLLRILMIRGRD